MSNKLWLGSAIVCFTLSFIYLLGMWCVVGVVGGYFVKGLLRRAGQPEQTAHNCPKFRALRVSPRSGWRAALRTAN